MNIRRALLPNWGIIVMLMLIAVANLISSFYELPLLLKTLTLVIIPIILLLYFYKEKSMANIFFVTFILIFCGIAFSIFENSLLWSKISEASFLGAYGLILFVMIGKIKHIKFQGLISVYLLTILAVNAYFMYVMFTSVQDSFQDSVIFTLTVSKGVALLLMAFLAFAIYLSKETLQSIIFLTVVFCLVFSDVLRFLTAMYVDNWLFSAAYNILQAAGLLLFCIYVFNHHQKQKRVLLNEFDSSAEASNSLIV